MWRHGLVAADGNGSVAVRAAQGVEMGRPSRIPIAQRVLGLVQRAVDEPVVVQPTEGGSLQMHLFAEAGIPFVGLPLFNHDCNQHAPDESVRLDDLLRGVDVLASVLLWE